MSALRLLLPVAALLFTSCTLFFSAPRPMAYNSIPVVRGKQARDALVLLPGRGDGAAELVAAGLPALIRQSGWRVDVYPVDATFGYYIRRNLVPVLHKDVMQPLLKKGYRRIWMLGISAGGFGALLYTQKHPGIVHGAIVLAPFLGGNKKLYREIASSGGLKKWQPSLTGRAKSDPIVQFWISLKAQVSAEEGKMPIYLGYGREDGFAFENGLLGAALPRSRVFIVPGAHDWSPWRDLVSRIARSIAAGD